MATLGLTKRVAVIACDDASQGCGLRAQCVDAFIESDTMRSYPSPLQVLLLVVVFFVVGFLLRLRISLSCAVFVSLRAASVALQPGGASAKVELVGQCNHGIR